jgi:serine protease AprX
MTETNDMNLSDHDHQHTPNRFAVIPTNVRLKAHPGFTGRGVTMAFLDSGFYPHPDLVEPINRIDAYEDLSNEYPRLVTTEGSASWQWHGTQTTVAAAGNGNLSGGTYRGLAPDARLILVKVSDTGRITEDNIAKGIYWVIQHRERFNIRILNISLGGDEDVPCSKSTIDQAAEEAIRQGIVVVVAAGNSGYEGKHSIPPANSPSVITVGGYTDNNVDGGDLELYQSNFGYTVDGTHKPEIIAPAMWVAAPILPGTSNYRRAEALSKIAAAFDYELPDMARSLCEQSELPLSLMGANAATIRNWVESTLNEHKIVATHYQHVDGTSFAAPIVSSIVAQMLEANPKLSPAAVKNILISTAERIKVHSPIRQGYGVVNAPAAVAAALSETHELEPPGCNSLGRNKSSVCFVYHNDKAESVALAGELNNWTRTQLERDQAGLWQLEIDIPPPGSYQYKFVVDGNHWVEDPNKGLKTSDNHGGFNSILVVEQEGIA